ncbi:MAG: beta-lactamase family protein [Verrucomicrobia bacterium]|nr:beta-lactamase family protein [Verrucomicrobiota bacterium]
MKRAHWLALAVVCIGGGAAGIAGASEDLRLPRSSPESQGMASGEILAFIDTAEKEIDALHSFMLVRHGHVVAEGWWAPYGPEIPHMLYSLSKSFTSTAVGMAVAEGRMSVDDSVLAAFPEHGPAEAGAQLEAMRVRDLLRMATGHHTEPAVRLETNWIKAFLAQEVAHKPGTFFLYNTPATFMLSAMVQKATGTTVLDFLQPRLFAPLGIENPTWGTSPEGITLGGYGLSVRTEDIARLGQLYLQRGQWRGQQLLPAEWVAEATSRQIANGSNPRSDWDQGYGYQFWRCRHNAYRGDGAFGQYCIVMPDQDAVVAITSGVRDMQSVMNMVWDRLLPAMRAAALPADPVAHQALWERLSRLKLPPAPGAASSPRATEWVGKRYEFPKNDSMIESVRIESVDGGVVTLSVRRDGVEQRLVSAHGDWRENRFSLGATPPQRAAVSGAWVGEDTYVVKICFHETPHHLTLRMRFGGDELLLDAEYNVAFGPTKLPQLIGQVR